ncbi:MAG TPA: hypothetical protein VFS07_10530 [Gemmatimonadales bacterium]|nr:hypothetical protein [Gemmatimonadales bacterium]
MPRSLRLAALALALAGCHIETRPPAGVARVKTTVQAAVDEHYRARNALLADSLTLTVLRRQVDARRDLASVWVTLRVHRTLPAAARDTTRLEHLLLRRTAAGWEVLSAAPAGAP